MAWSKPEAKNIECTVENGVIVIRIDPKVRLGPSSTGKTIIVAKGSVEVPGEAGMAISLTAYTK